MHLFGVSLLILFNIPCLFYAAYMYHICRVVVCVRVVVVVAVGCCFFTLYLPLLLGKLIEKFKFVFPNEVSCNMCSLHLTDPAAMKAEGFYSSLLRFPTAQGSSLCAASNTRVWCASRAHPTDYTLSPFPR